MGYRGGLHPARLKCAAFQFLSNVASSGVLFAAAMVRAMDELERGRESYAASAWLDVYESLSRADQSEKLGAAVAQLDEEGRVALQREVVAAWQPFTEDGTLILQVGTTTVSARR